MEINESVIGRIVCDLFVLNQGDHMDLENPTVLREQVSAALRTFGYSPEEHESAQDEIIARFTRILREPRL